MRIAGATPKLTGWQIAAKMTDDQLGLLGKIAEEKGYTTQAMVARLGLAGAGGFLEMASLSEERSGTEKKVMRTVGALLLMAAGGSAVSSWMKRSAYTRNMILAWHPEAILTKTTGQQEVRSWRELVATSKALGTTHGEMMRQTFKDERSKFAAMFVLDEGAEIAPEYAFLNVAQQNAAKAGHELNLWLGMRMKELGIIDDYVQNYVRHLLPPETYAKWRQTYPVALSTGGPFTKHRKIPSLRELIEFSREQGLPGPIMDPAHAQHYHIQEAYRAIANANMKKSLERVGMIRALGKGEVPNAGWEEIRGMRGKVAPKELATAIENMSAPRASSNEIANAADVLKSYWMRSIMFWFWEHGLNAMRSIPAISLNPVTVSKGLVRSWKAVTNADPVLFEWARYGGNPFGRPDYGVQTARTFERAISGLDKHAPSIRNLQMRGAHLIHMQDRLLWNKIIPTIGMFAYSTEMKRWAESVGYKFMPNSPEYAAAARRIADFSNRIMGKVPTEMQNPTLARTMRLMLFSPQWSLTRISITGHAMGELGDFAAGNLKWNAALNLQFKMRQLLALAAVTWVGSKLLSGEEPVFNENTNKFYMKTKLRSATGRRIGVDLAGWWQDDIKLFNAPDQFLMGRLNPSLNAIKQMVEGRDYLGRRMTGMQRLDNLLKSFGPPAELAEFSIRGVEPGRMTGGELLQRASGIAATANISSLPATIDVTISRVAKRILREQGIPANEDNVYDIARQMRINLLQGGDITQGVISSLAYMKRQHEREAGIASWLWQKGREVLSATQQALQPLR